MCDVHQAVPRASTPRGAPLLPCEQVDFPSVVLLSFRRFTSPWVNRGTGRGNSRRRAASKNVSPLSTTSRRYAWGAHGFVTTMVHDSSIRRALGYPGLAIVKESGCDMERRATLPVITAACSILKISSSASTRGQSPPPKRTSGLLVHPLPRIHMRSSQSTWQRRPQTSNFKS